MLELVRGIQTHAPPGSILIVEADEAFDFGLLRDVPAPRPGAWDVRTYPPAVVGLWRC
jgi:hypothetical protein